MATTKTFEVFYQGANSNMIAQILILQSVLVIYTCKINAILNYIVIAFPVETNIIFVRIVI